MLGQYFFGITIFITSMFLIMLVLVQRGRGGGLAGALGGPGGQSAFGTKAGDLFTRITIVVAAIWIFLCAAAVVALKDRSIRTGVDRSSSSAVGAENIGGDQAELDSTGSPGIDAAAPGTASPGVVAPTTETPITETPTTETPTTETPTTETPTTETPTTETPTTETPSADNPATATPDELSPAGAAPGSDADPAAADAAPGLELDSSAVSPTENASDSSDAATDSDGAADLPDQNP